MDRTTVESYAAKITEPGSAFTASVSDTSVVNFATPANRYPLTDRRHHDVVGYLVSYTWTVQPFNDIFGNPGITPPPERRYVLIADQCGKWTSDMFLIDDGTSVQPFYVCAWRLTCPEDRPDLDDGIDPHLILCPVEPSETAYGAYEPRQCHHVITWDLDTPRSRS